MQSEDVHNLIHLIRCETLVDMFHCRVGVAHRSKRLLVDVGRFDGVDLLFQSADLRNGLVERVLVCLLTP